MAKSDLINDILKLDNSYKKSDLEDMKVTELQSILEGVSSDIDKSIEKEMPFDLAKIKEEMYQQLKEEMKKETEVEGEKGKSERPTFSSNIDPVIKRKESIDKQMLVPIMNVTNGKLIYQSKKSGSEFQFEKYGDIEYMELYEILTMRSSQRRFLDEPYVIVLDEEVAEYLGLSNLYKKLTHATEIDRIFTLPLERFKEVVESVPKGLAHLIVSKAKEKLENGQLDSVQKVQILEDIYNVELSN